MMPTDNRKKRAEPNAPIQFVTCLDCGEQQADMGQGVNCENCGYGPMPWYDDDGELHD